MQIFRWPALVCLLCLEAGMPAVAADSAATAPAGHSNVDAAALAAMPAEQQAAYLAGVADGMAFAMRWPADRAHLLTTCMRGFTGDQLAETVRQFRPAPSGAAGGDEPAPLSLALAMVEACQLQWGPPEQE